LWGFVSGALMSFSKTSNIRVEVIRRDEDKEERLTIWSTMNSLDSKPGEIPAVEVERQGEQINIYLFAFEQGVADQLIRRVREELDSLKKEFGPEAEATFLLDVRNNPGGSVGEMQKIIAAFTPGNANQALTKTTKSVAHIFQREGIIGSARREVNGAVIAPMLPSASEDLFEGKMVVVVNGLSGSAAEVLAMVLRESGRAVTIGTKTYGKFFGQSLVSRTRGGIPHLGGNFWVTTMEFLDPAERSFARLGYEPDVSIVDPVHLDWVRDCEAEMADKTCRPLRFAAQDPLVKLPAHEGASVFVEPVSIDWFEAFYYNSQGFLNAFNGHAGDESPDDIQFALAGWLLYYGSEPEEPSDEQKTVSRGY